MEKKQDKKSYVHIHVIPREIGDGAGPVHSMLKNKPNVSSFDSLL